VSLPAAAGADPPLVAECVYKPVRGERPLDDFPDGTLARRERAAYLLSVALGWNIVPPTVLRDGPFGRGMVQRWIDVDPQQDVVAMVFEPDLRLRRICLFDAIANNADRKGSHLLPLQNGHVYAVDHGVCFAAQPKLRTVLWAWRGQPLAEVEAAATERVADEIGGELGESLAELLSREEVLATQRRAADLGRRRKFPLPDPTRPSLPWPPF